MIFLKVATGLVEMLKTPSPLRGTPYFDKLSTGSFQRESWRVEPRFARSVGSPPAKERCPDLSGRGGQFPDTMMSWWQDCGLSLNLLGLMLKRVYS